MSHHRQNDSRVNSKWSIFIFSNFDNSVHRMRSHPYHLCRSSWVKSRKGKGVVHSDLASCNKLDHFTHCHYGEFSR